MEMSNLKAPLTAAITTQSVTEPSGKEGSGPVVSPLEPLQPTTWEHHEPKTDLTGTYNTTDDGDGQIRAASTRATDASDGTERSESSSGPNNDLDTVWWDGDDDPEHPYNWPSRQVMLNCVWINIGNFLAPLGATIFAPAAPQVVRDLDVHSLQLATFVVSVDVLGFAFGPLLLAPLSEVYGRAKMYTACSFGFLISTVLSGSAPNMASLIVFRFFSGVFGACFGTIGGGSIADMVRPEKRAGIMAICGAGSLLGPILGPIFGGFINASWGWRWTQWTVAIAASVPTTFILFTFRECYHPVLLERKAARLRKETGRLSLKSKYDQGLSLGEHLRRSIVRPLKLLFRSPIVTISALFIGISYAILFVMFTSITSVFHETYNFSASSVGLAFTGMGVGSFIGVAVYSIASNRYLKRKKAAELAVVLEDDAAARSDDGGAGGWVSLEQGNLQPEDRLPLLPIGCLMPPVGLLVYGWTIQYCVHWIVPILATTLIGTGNVIIYMSLQMFLVESFTIFATSALAAMTVVRSLAAALLPLSGLELYDTLGVGWGNSLLAFIIMLFVPIALIIKKAGAKLRKRYEIKSL